MSRIAVLVSTRTDPVSGRATRSAADAAAVSLALSLEREPLVVGTADLPESVARDYLALGLHVVHRLPAPAEGEAAVRLAAAVEAAPLLLCGARAEGGLGSGLLPYQVAKVLQRSLIPDVISVAPDGAAWQVRQALPRGARRCLRLSRPAVLVLSDRAAPATRHAYDAARRGRIETLPPASTTAMGVVPLAWRSEPARRQLRALAPRQTLSAQARMSQAVGGGPAPTGGQVVQGGTVEDQARALLAHLRSIGLVP